MADLSTAASALGPLGLPASRNGDFTGKAVTTSKPVGATRLYQIGTPFAAPGLFAGKSQATPGATTRPTRNPMLASAGRLMTRR
jgi:hypothetical protein